MAILLIQCSFALKSTKRVHTYLEKSYSSKRTTPAKAAQLTTGFSSNHHPQAATSHPPTCRTALCATTEVSSWPENLSKGVQDSSHSFWHQNRNSDYSKIMNDIFGMSILFSDFCRLLWKKSKWPIENSHSKKSLWPTWLPVATAQQHGRKQGHSGRPLSTFLLNNNVHHPRSFFQLNPLKKGTLFSEERILLKASFCRRIC